MALPRVTPTIHKELSPDRLRSEFQGQGLVCGHVGPRAIELLARPSMRREFLRGWMRRRLPSVAVLPFLNLSGDPAPAWRRRKSALLNMYYRSSLKHLGDADRASQDALRLAPLRADQRFQALIDRI